MFAPEDAVNLLRRVKVELGKVTCIAHEPTEWHKVLIWIYRRQSIFLGEDDDDCPMRKVLGRITYDKRVDPLANQLREHAPKLHFSDRAVERSSNERDPCARCHISQGTHQRGYQSALHYRARAKKAHPRGGWDDLPQQFEALVPNLKTSVWDDTGQIAARTGQAFREPKRHRVRGHRNDRNRSRRRPEVLDHSG